MRYWAQFYSRRLREENGTSYFVEGVGDRQLIYLDGRLSVVNMAEIARRECRIRGYDGFRIARGHHLSKPFYLNAAVQAVM